jgi:hypothetical protein
MSVWEAWLDLHVAAVTDNPTRKQEYVNFGISNIQLNLRYKRYETVLPVIADAILAKLLMSSNSEILDALDETSRDEEVSDASRIVLCGISFGHSLNLNWIILCRLG